MSAGLELDWDDENTKHLAAHRVTRAEFEQVLRNDPMDLDYEYREREDRFRQVGSTERGRVLLIVWTLRDAKLRPVTAFTAGPGARKVFLERLT